MPLLGITRRISGSAGAAVWRKNEKVKLEMAGYSEVFTPEDFIGIRILFILIALLLWFWGVLSGRLAIPFLMGILIAIYPRVWLSSTIKARQLSIMKALPNLLDLLTLSVESGKDLLSSLRDILSRRRPDPLGEEPVWAHLA